MMKKHQMTLIEVLVAMGVLLIIMSVLAAMVLAMNTISRKQRKQSEVYQEQRLLIDVISQDLASIVCSNISGRKVLCNFDQSSGPGTKGIFVTCSGLGTDSTKYSNLMEVAYEYTSDSKLIRHFTAAPVNPPSPSASPAFTSGAWNFFNNPTATWSSSMPSSVELSTSVDSFYFEAFSGYDGLDFNGDTEVTPSMIVVTLKLYDDVDDTVRTFRKKIFLKQGN